MKRSILRSSLIPALLTAGFILLDLGLDLLMVNSATHATSHLILVASGAVIVFVSTYRQMETRSRAEAAAQHYQSDLESQVRLRTAELEQANAQLQAEIAERVRVEEALRASEAKFSAVFHASPDAIAIFRTKDGVVLDVNEAFGEVFGYTRSEVVAHTWSELNSLVAPSRAAELTQLHQTHGQVADYELDLTTHQGDIATILLSLIPMTVSGEPCLAAIAHDITNRRRSETALHQAQVALAESARERAMQEERQRLARDLHDSMSQTLYGISLGANTGLKLFDVDRAKVREALNYVLSLAQSGLTEMRALIFDLRPESLEVEGLVAALTHQAAVYLARYDIEVGLSLCDEPDVSLQIKEALYRIAQEALNNAARHARSTQVEIHLTQGPDGLTLEIFDDGVGFDPTASYPGHLGLHSMHERAADVGGTLDIASASGHGTRVRAWIPADANLPNLT